MTVLIQNVPTPETLDSKPSNSKHTQGDDFTSPMIEAVPMEKSIKADTCLLITNKEQIISLVPKP
jgi:hypothetical protein